MKKAIVLLFCLCLAPLLAPTVAEEKITLAYGESYECPNDGCSLYYTGKDQFCVGIRCRHVQIYRCGCCSKEWAIYVD